MKPRKYQNPPPARSEGSSSPPARPLSEHPLTPADEVEILVAPRIPRRWLHVVLTLSADADPSQAALAAAWFATRMRAIDKRLRLTLDREKSSTTAGAGKLLLAFAPLQGGALGAEWLEEVKPAVRELAIAEFPGAEVRAVDVISE